MLQYPAGYLSSRLPQKGCITVCCVSQNNAHACILGELRKQDKSFTIIVLMLTLHAWQQEDLRFDQT